MQALPSLLHSFAVKSTPSQSSCAVVQRGLGSSCGSALQLMEDVEGPSQPTAPMRRVCRRSHQRDSHTPSKPSVRGWDTSHTHAADAQVRLGLAG